MTGAEFVKYPSIPRLFRPYVITEKIDGTNAAVVIEEKAYGESAEYGNGAPPGVVRVLFSTEINPDTGNPDKEFWLRAQSRNRFIVQEDDNYGFARYVWQEAEALTSLLGPGRHYGEWWGVGIQRGYGLRERRFSLFNVKRYEHIFGNEQAMSIGLRVVPILDAGPVFTSEAVRGALTELEEHGSFAAPGYMNPEGIVVHHLAAQQSFKVTLDDNDQGKWTLA